MALKTIVQERSKIVCASINNRSLKLVLHIYLKLKKKLRKNTCHLMTNNYKFECLK